MNLTTLLKIALSTVFFVLYSLTSKAQDLEWINEGMQKNPRQTIDSVNSLLNSRKTDPFTRSLLLDRLTSIYFFDLRDYKTAFQTVKKIEQEYKRSGDKRIKIIQLENLGMLYFESKVNKSKAYSLFNEAYSTSLAEGTNFHAEYILSNHGVSLLNSQAPDKAYVKFHEALKFSRKSQDLAQRSAILNNLGIYHLIQKNTDSAAYYLLASFDVAKKSQSKEDELERAIYLGAFFRDMDQLQKADSFLSYALEHVSYLKKFDSKRFLCELISEVREKEANYSDALKFQKLASRYRDSIDFSNLSKQLLSAENRIKIVKLENQMARSKERNVTIVIISGLILLILTIIAFLLISKNKHKAQLAEIEAKKRMEERDKISEELEETDRDVAVKSMVLLEKETMMNKVTTLLKSAMTELKPEDQGVIKEVINEINFSMNNKAWEEFELRFNKVHPQFYKKLDDTHGGLTLNEKKLAAFLLMNMTTKDISNITGQTPHSINVARTRLRKKMGLANSNTSFTEYLTRYI